MTLKIVTQSFRKMSNYNLVLQRQKDELVKKENHLKERERGLKEEIKTAVTEAKKKERDWIVEKVGWIFNSFFKRFKIKYTLFY